MMQWHELDLTRKDGHPEPGMLCLIRRVVPNERGGKWEYLVGRFERDPLNPESPRLWWRDGRGAVTENAVNWKRRYSDIIWSDICPPPVEEVRE